MRKALLTFLTMAAAAAPAPSRGAVVIPSMESSVAIREGSAGPIDVIVQYRPSLKRSRARSIGVGHVKHRYDHLNMVAITVSPDELRTLAADPQILAITLDDTVSTMATPSSSLIQQVGGADAAARTFAVTGSGVGIAVLDSGVYPHIDLPVRASANMVTGSTTTSDLFGHGTHVAGLALGSGKGSFSSGMNFAGIAPGASLVNVKVLDDTGKGKVSWVLAGIDWVLANRSRYKIKVVNLSLGMPASASYKFDALCQATRSLHDAGIVVVAAAGNYGKAADGSAAYGSITSPGNSPWVITVGAVNDHGTPPRSDDSVALYSSRGPTRSADPTTHVYDNLVKPDLVATGNHLVGPEARDNWIVTNFPSFDLNNLHGAYSADYMYLNGTSMAAPIVSGTVALMLQANPSLKPAQVKAILMYTAQTLPSFSVFEQGAGEANAEGAVRIAKALRGAPLNSTVAGTVLLAPSKMPSSSSSALSGETVNWSRGYVLIQKAGSAELVEAGGVLFAEGVIFAEGMFNAKGIAFSEGLIASAGVIFAERSALVAGRVIAAGTIPAMTSRGYLNATSVQMTQGATLGNGDVLTSNGVLFSAGVLFAEGVIFAERNAAGTRLTVARSSALSNEPCFSQGVLFAEGDLVNLFASANNVLVAGEAFIYY